MSKDIRVNLRSLTKLIVSMITKPYPIIVRSHFFCTQDSDRKKKPKPSLAKHRDTLGMKWYPYKSRLSIKHRERNLKNAYTVIILRHNFGHVNYIDVAIMACQSHADNTRSSRMGNAPRSLLRRSTCGRSKARPTGFVTTFRSHLQ